jgi:hypothetical protein
MSVTYDTASRFRGRLVELADAQRRSHSHHSSNDRGLPMHGHTPAQVALRGRDSQGVHPVSLWNARISIFASRRTLTARSWGSCHLANCRTHHLSQDRSPLLRPLRVDSK